jgi:hypothetical protein
MAPNAFSAALLSLKHSTKAMSVRLYCADDG